MTHLRKLDVAAPLLILPKIGHWHSPDVQIHPLDKLLPERGSAVGLKPISWPAGVAQEMRTETSSEATCLVGGKVQLADIDVECLVGADGALRGGLRCGEE